MATTAAPLPEAEATALAKHSGKELKTRTWTTYLPMLLLSVFFLLPLVIMFVGAFKLDSRVLADGESLRAFVPNPFDGENFSKANDRAGLFTLFRNSVIVSVVTVAVGLVVNSLMGYALARVPFKMSKLMLVGIIALTIVPFQAVAIPLLFLVSELGWTNTLYVQILPFIAQPLFVYLFYSFFLAVPKELEEAARIDGCGPVRTFVSVVLPLAKPAFATVGILHFLQIWGELLWPVLVTTDESVRPLPYGMSIFYTQPPISWGDLMAYATVTTLPLLIAFLFFQRWFVQSVARSGLKG
jgi:multiple sugar transport system permease protein